MTLYELEREAIAELRAWREDNPGEVDVADVIFAIADGAVPVMTHTLLQLAADNLHLAVTEPELGPANGSNFDGTNCPVNWVAANIFEHLEARLWEEWTRIQEEEDEEADDDAA